MISFGNFDTPIEDYTKDLRKVKTFAEFKDFEKKYFEILDDAAPAVAAMTEATFEDFRKELPWAFREGRPPSDIWMNRFGAIVLPELIIDLSFLIAYLPSGMILRRLLREGMAEMKDGRFVLKR